MKERERGKTRTNRFGIQECLENANFVSQKEWMGSTELLLNCAQNKKILKEKVFFHGRLIVLRNALKPSSTRTQNTAAVPDVPDAFL